MKLTSKLVILLIIFLGFISVSDLILRPGHPITFDGHVHMTTMNQFAQSLRDGEFPVTWSNNFANYGLPLPLFAHQLPAYLGAGLILIGFSTETAFITLIVASIITTSILFYIFFRKFSSKIVSFAATVLAIFFPYRALNIYTRGALPEIMSAIFLPLLFLGVWNLRHKKYSLASFLIFSSTLGIALTHPMMLVVFGIPTSIYFFSGLNKKTWKKQSLFALLGVGLGVLTASYYLLPLILEMKYFHQSFLTSEINLDRFLSIKQLYDPSWFYTLTHPGPRGNYIKLGIFEFTIFIGSIMALFLSKIKSFKKNFDNKKIKPLMIWVSMSLASVILTLPISISLYSLPIVNQIQYPWRFLNVLQFLIPGLFVMITQAIPKLQNVKFIFLLIITILWFRAPQFYGKNYVSQPESDYEFNQSNLHSVNMNPIWSSNSEDYPVKSIQAEIIEGNGKMEFEELKNSSRKYRVNAVTQVRIIDYTFYFSGWEVLLNGKPINFEFQDGLYRGIITYKIPAGSHEVVVRYVPTTVRKIGNAMTIAGFITSIVFLIFATKVQKRSKTQLT